MGDKEKQDSPEGVHTITQRETRKGTMGDKGRQDLREGRHTIQHQGRDPKIAVRTSNSTPFGKQWDSRPSGRRTHHPRRAQRESRSSRRPAPSKKGYNGNQKPSAHHPRRGYTGSQDPSRRRTHHPRRGTTGVKTLEKADTPSKKESRHTIQKGVEGGSQHS